MSRDAGLLLHEFASDGQRPARKRGEDPLVGLARSWRLPGSPNGVPGLAGASASSWSRPGRVTISRPCVARVHVTARRPNAELNSLSAAAPVSGWTATVIAVRLALVGVDGRAEQVVSVSECWSRKPLDRLGGVVDRLVAGREDRDERVAGAVARLCPLRRRRSARRRRRTAACDDREARRRTARRAASSTNPDQRQVDVGRLGSGSPSTSSSVGTPVPTCRQMSAAAPVSRRRVERPVAGSGDAVQRPPTPGRTRATVRGARRSVATRPGSSRVHVRASSSKSVGQARKGL